MNSQDVGGPNRASRHAGPDPVSVLLVDEHTLNRAGVRTILEVETDFHVLAEAASVEEAVAVCAGAAPNVVLVDLETTSGDLLNDVARLRGACAGAAVVVLSHTDSDSELYQAALAGAAAHVAAVAEPAELARVIGRAARGEEPIGQQIRQRPRVARRLLESFQLLVAQGGKGEASPLSERELEVLRLAAEGFTNAQIGRQLGLSASTVRTVLSGILARLGLRHRTQAVVHALRQGWIGLPDREPEAH